MTTRRGARSGHGIRESDNGSLTGASRQQQGGQAQPCTRHHCASSSPACLVALGLAACGLVTDAEGTRPYLRRPRPSLPDRLNRSLAGHRTWYRRTATRRQASRPPSSPCAQKRRGATHRQQFPFLEDRASAISSVNAFQQPQPRSARATPERTRFRRDRARRWLYPDESSRHRRRGGDHGSSFRIVERSSRRLSAPTSRAIWQCSRSRRRRPSHPDATAIRINVRRRRRRPGRGQPARRRADGHNGYRQREGARDRAGDGSYEDFIQTDAPINQGNSGGALVNTQW